LRPRLAAAVAIAGLAAATASSAAERLTGPLAPAASGHLLCSTPYPASKTCESLAAFRIDAAGVIQKTNVLLFLDGVTIETTTPVVIHGDQVCGTLRAQDIDAAKIAADNGGGPVSDAKAADAKAQYKLGFEDSFDREVCTAFVQTDAGLMAQATVAGERDSGLDRMAAWVGSDEGYRAAP
jgi:hypothetical protein